MINNLTVNSNSTINNSDYKFNNNDAFKLSLELVDGGRQVVLWWCKIGGLDFAQFKEDLRVMN